MLCASTLLERLLMDREGMGSRRWMADASSDWVQTAYRSSYISCPCAGLSSSNTYVEWVESECGARAVLVLGQLKLGSLEMNPSGSLGPACDSQPVFLAAVRNPEHTQAQQCHGGVGLLLSAWLSCCPCLPVGFVLSLGLMHPVGWMWKKRLLLETGRQSFST